MDAHSQNRFRTGVCLTVICSTLFLMAACQQSKVPGASQGITEVAWARMALERNPNLEVVATDTQAGVFTVRDKRTGQVQAVRLSELAAVPVSQLSAQIARPAAGAEPVEPFAPEPSATDASRFDTQAAPPAPASKVTEAPPATPAQAAKSSMPEESKDYTIERADGQVKVSGPGISIVSSARTTATEPAAEAGMRKGEPIICEGQRMVHLDNRSINVNGDGVTARAGCELYLTNSRIVASGTGVVVQDAVVHIANSYVEGASGSFEAAIGSKLFVRDSIFNGLSRRDSFAEVQDQGGNEWR
jgi:hypothetical protein